MSRSARETIQIPRPKNCEYRVYRQGRRPFAVIVEARDHEAALQEYMARFFSSLQEELRKELIEGPGEFFDDQVVIIEEVTGQGAWAFDVELTFSARATPINR